MCGMKIRYDGLVLRFSRTAALSETCVWSDSFMAGEAEHDGTAGGIWWHYIGGHIGICRGRNSSLGFLISDFLLLLNNKWNCKGKAVRQRDSLGWLQVTDRYKL